MESDFKTTINELLSGRALSTAKLSELSGVPERYIEAMRVGNFEHLPPAPYVRGYLNKIAAILGSNSDELWKKYKNESDIKVSGGEDRLPSNRFSLKKLSKSKMALGATAILVLTYAGVRFRDIIGIPELSIISPTTVTVFATMPDFQVSGIIKPGDKLTINGESEPVGADGKFQKNIRLYPGINNVDFRVKRFLGREIQDVRQIIFRLDNQPANLAAPTSTDSASSATSSIR